ncbi:DUF4189 domain-containing protein [Xanthomonas hortorum]|uniref:DUF4189 domain-containing protein n=1 Tax=Xanthomonas hortorum TaxID=56454 RepID=A0AA47EU10_9XANT|nr:DUF4189 domain-containing protein [Xanthomonas hortorum]WAH64140.1 DUF4189 domain-containing protein [Xanthomonas hortorum]
MNISNSNSILLAFFLLMLATSVLAEGGCPPGQYPIGGQGAMACAPMPQDNAQQQPRPIGKWIKTWGAIASDGGDNLGVAAGKIKKNDAQQDAESKCSSQSGKKCNVVFSYQNQCAAIAEPYQGEKAASGKLAFTGAPSKQLASDDALSLCRKDNKDFNCRVIYTACSEPIFEKF